MARSRGARLATSASRSLASAMTCRLNAAFRPSTMTGFFGPISSTSVLSAIRHSRVHDRIAAASLPPMPGPVRTFPARLSRRALPASAGADVTAENIAAARAAVLAKLSAVRQASQRSLGMAQNTQKDRLDRDGPHGLPDGGAAVEGRLRRLDLEPHPRQGRAARQVRRQDRRQAQRSLRHGHRVLHRRRGQGRRAGLFRQGRRAIRQQDAGACSSTARPSRSRNWRAFARR